MRLCFTPLILLLAIACTITVEAHAAEMCHAQFEVLDVADLDCDGAPLLVSRVPEVVQPHGVDNDCDGDTQPPAMREPDHWRYDSDSTASWHRCLMVRHSYGLQAHQVNQRG